MKDYVVVINGKPAGPYSVEQMKGLRIKPGTFVKSEDMDDYKEAHDVPELCDLLGIKRHIREPQYFASLDIRLLAVIIDYFIIFAIYCVIAMMVVFFIDEKQLRIVVSLAGLAIIPISKIIYSTIMESSARQGTWGKILMGLKVCDEKGIPVNFSRSLVRNLSKIISTATVGLGYLMGFFDKRQQCLHDKIAGTLVIKDRLI
ncbi:MAG: RDD family protein [Bacteroidota bacterium]|nr:RDD family protein [Bacteroidota bacterium]